MQSIPRIRGGGKKQVAPSKPDEKYADIKREINGEKE